MIKICIRIAGALLLCGIPALFLAAAGAEPEGADGDGLIIAVPARSLQSDVFPAQFRFAPAPLISPHWTTDLPNETETLLYFWGFSGKSKDRREAETNALQDAKLRISGYIFEVVEGSYTESSQYKNERGSITDDSEVISEFSQSYTKSILEGVKPIMSQPSRNADGTMEVQILVSVSKAVIVKKREEIDQRVKDLSALYTSEIKNHKGTGLETLRKYEQITSKLNLLERTLVNYHGAAQPVNLYTYLTEQINKLADTVYVASVEFRGEFKNFEKETLFAALQNGLKNNGVQLQLVHTANTDFKIVVSGEPEESMYASTFRWRMPGLSLQFMQGSSIKESSYITVPIQVDRAWLINETGKKINLEKEFFLKIKDIFKRG